jgi:carbonic anhydrase/acetyltransferase-like protein (isoleucine patch superfamily)
MLDIKNIRPRVHPASFVAPGAHLIGAVNLKEGASVWYNCVLRGDLAKIVIGENTNIQDNTVIHVDRNTKTVLGRNVTVGHGAIIHACTVEDNCLIGMGAVILDGACIRAGSIVGAGAVVPPGKDFPERSMIIGAPAVVKRPLEDDEVERLIEYARDYRSFWEEYVKQGIGQKY